MDTGDWRSERPVVNYNKCGQCGWCYLYCPVGCIVEENGYYVPNLDFCKGCGICAKECPSQSITMITEEVE